MVEMNSYQQHGQEMMGCLMIILIGVVPILFAMIASLFIPWVIPFGVLAIFYWVLFKRRKKSKKN